MAEDGRPGTPGTAHGLHQGRARLALGLAVGLLLLLVVLGASVLVIMRTSELNEVQRQQSEAARIAGRPVRVTCDDGYAYTGLGSDTLGVAFPQRGLATIRPSVCRTLHDALAGDRPVSDTTGEAVLVLAHEAIHLRGERREGVTECLGLQEGVALATRLGWSRGDAERLMRIRYDAVLADRSITRLSYALPSGCRDGGSLDIRPGDATFP